MKTSLLIALLIGLASPISFGGSVSVKSSQKVSPPSKKLTLRPLDVPTVKTKFIRKELKKELPKFICSDQAKTRRCHKISKKQCYKIIKKQLSKCIKAQKSKRLISSIESMRYSQSVGLCLKNRVEPRIKKYKKDCDLETK